MSDRTAISLRATAFGIGNAGGCVAPIDQEKVVVTLGGHGEGGEAPADSPRVLIGTIHAIEDLGWIGSWVAR